MGRDKKSTRTTTTNLSWTVKSVSANGDAEIDCSASTACACGSSSLRSSARVRLEPEQIERFPKSSKPLERQIKAMAGAELTFKLRPTGEVDRSQDPRANLEGASRGRTARTRPRRIRRFRTRASKTCSCSRARRPFPRSRIEPGKTWAAKPSKMPIPGLGNAHDRQGLHFSGTGPQNAATCCWSASKSKVTLEPAENVTAKIRKQEGKGTPDLRRRGRPHRQQRATSRRWRSSPATVARRSSNRPTPRRR